MAGLDDGPSNGIGLRIRLVDTFAVYRSGVIEPTTAVGTRKARRLLALLAVEHGSTVRAERIVEALWGGAPPQQPAENIATLVSRLRTTLGPDSVIGGRDGYRLGEALRVDLYDGAGLVAAAEARLASGDPAGAQAAAGQALRILGEGGVLADEPDAVWADRARGLHAALLRRGRHTIAAAALHRNDRLAARAAADAAVAADPLDEVAHRLLMRAYDASGEPARALLAYERLRIRLHHDLGVDPAPSTRDLHAAILRTNAATVTTELVAAAK